MPHEIIPSANARMGGLFSATDHDGDGVDIGLCYGKTERDIYLLISASSGEGPQTQEGNVMLSLADARALRDHLNGLDLSDPPAS